MVEALNTRRARTAMWLGAGVLLVLLAGPWLQPGSYRDVVERNLNCTAPFMLGIALAWGLWAGGIWVRVISGGCLVLAAVAGAPLEGAILVALPGLAALRRMSPVVVDEARVGGAGWFRILTQLVMPAALAGELYGILLCLAPGGYWRVVAAALPLVLG